MRNASSKRRGAGYLALAGAITALVYAAVLLRLPLTRVYATPLLNLNRIPAKEWPLGAGVLACIAILFAAYALGALALVSFGGRDRSGRSGGELPAAKDAPFDPSPATRRQIPLARLLIVGFPLLFAILLIFTHPATSTDVYDYLFRGRMLARYQANPFVAFPWQFRADPLIKYVAWKLVVTAYGPLWEGLSWATIRLAGEAPGAPGLADGARLLTLILAYKGLAALSFLLCGAAIWLALRRAPPQQRWLGVYLWLWNPLALWETIGAAHNDAWMALCIVLAVAALEVRQGDKGIRGEREGPVSSTHLLVSSSPGLAALLALTAGGLIKFVAFFFGPLALAAALRRQAGWRARVGLLAAAGGACAALAALAYAPFWDGWATFENVRDRRDLYTSTWLGTLRVILKRGMPEDRAAAIVAAAGLALLCAGILWASWRAWREPERLRAHMLWLALWFLFVCNPWFQPWYAVWPLALAAAQPWRARAVAGVIALCMVSMAGYVAGGLVLPALGLPDKSIGREAWMAALITLPPLLVFGWDRVASAARALRRRLPSVAARPERTVESGSR